MTTKQIGHTKTPWEYAVSSSPEYKPNGLAFDICLPNGGDMIADLKDCANAEENAAFIVRACNSHEALVEALERARNRVIELTEMNYSSKNASYETLDIINQALKLAKY